jgi:hypothetical protein
MVHQDRRNRDRVPASALSRVASFDMIGAFAFGPVTFAAGPRWPPSSTPEPYSVRAAQAALAPLHLARSIGPHYDLEDLSADLRRSRAGWLSLGVSANRSLRGLIAVLLRPRP